MMNLLVTIGKKQHHLSVKPGTPLPEALALLGFPIALPCGGKGSCGKCRVKATGQLSPITPAERRCLSAGELRNGLRLLCQTAVLGEARIELPEESAEIVVEGVSAMPQNRPIDGKALCAALDIGTTTVAARLYVAEELESSPVASAGRRNPQAAFGADVLSRMERAQAGDAPALRGCIIDCLDDLLTELMQMAQARPAQIRELVITGNTAMLYLLTGGIPPAFLKLLFCRSIFLGTKSLPKPWGCMQLRPAAFICRTVPLLLLGLIACAPCLLVG